MREIVVHLRMCGLGRALARLESVSQRAPGLIDAVAADDHLRAALVDFRRLPGGEQVGRPSLFLRRLTAALDALPEREP